MTSRSLNCLVLLLVLGLGLTSSYKIDDPYPSEREMDTVEDMTDEMIKLDELNAKGENNKQPQDIAASDSPNDQIKIEWEKLVPGCKLESKNKVPDKEVEERKKASEGAMKKHYQALVHHGKGSIADALVWLEAKRSELCTACVLRKFCKEQRILNILKIDLNLSYSQKEEKCIRKIFALRKEIFHSEEEKVKCNVDDRFRRIDGRCNNLENPLWGSVGDKFLRLEPADYGDGVSSLRLARDGSYLPNARKVSLDVHGDDDCENPDNSILTHLTMNFGQFMDHDITLAEAQGLNCEPNNHNPECINIEIPEGDTRLTEEIEQERDAPHKPAQSCLPLYREHSNVITAHIDASNVYGSTEELATYLREPGGRMRVMKHPHGCPMKNLLPAQTEGFCESKDPLRPCFVAGDERVNENQGLMSVHTIFVREHNRIAEFFGQNTQWSGDRIYEETRRIIAAALQVITYNEFLPLILSRKTIGDFDLKLLKGQEFFTGYDPDVNDQMTAEFSVAAYRFGHSLIQTMFRRFSQEGLEHKCDCDEKLEFMPITLCDFGNPTYLYDKGQGGMDAIFRGLVKDKAATIDRCLTECVQHALSRGEGDLADLAALNIQRGRERGVPGYTTIRNRPEFGIFPNVTKLEDLKDAGFYQSDIDNINVTYNGEVHDIDLFPGGLLEPPSKNGGLLGDTFQCVIAEQFKRLRVGDRFWHENEANPALHTDKTAFTSCQLQEIRKISFAKIICGNGDDIPAITRRVLSQSKIFVDCDNLPEPNLKVWLPSFKCGGVSADSNDDDDW